MSNNKIPFLSALFIVSSVAGCTLETLDCTEDNESDFCTANTLCIDGACRQANAGERCSNHTQCAEKSLICRNNQCTPGTRCTQNKDCKSTEICEADACKTVKIGDKCSEDTNCSSGLICIDNKCESGTRCKSNNDCPELEVCINTICRETHLESPCTNNFECSGNQICYGNICKQACKSSDDCNPTEVCSDKVCKTSNEGDTCANHDECTAEYACIAGVCSAGRRCFSDGDCADPEQCDSTDHICKILTPPPPPVDPTCTRDSDCEENQVCLDSHCIEGRRCLKTPTYCSNDNQQLTICDENGLIESEVKCDANQTCYEINDIAFCGHLCTTNDDKKSFCSPNIKMRFTCSVTDGVPSYSLDNCGRGDQQSVCINPNTDNTLSPKNETSCAITNTLPLSYECTYSSTDKKVTYNMCFHNRCEKLENTTTFETNPCLYNRVLCKEDNIHYVRINSAYIYFFDSPPAAWDFIYCAKRPRTNDQTSLSYHTCYNNRTKIFDIRSFMNLIKDLSVCDTKSSNYNKETCNGYKTKIKNAMDNPSKLMCCRPDSDFMIRPVYYNIYAIEPCTSLIQTGSYSSDVDYFKYIARAVRKETGSSSPVPDVTAYQIDGDHAVAMMDDSNAACYNDNTMLLYKEEDELLSANMKARGYMKFTHFSAPEKYREQSICERDDKGFPLCSLVCDAQLVPMYFIDQYVSQLKSTQRPVTCRISAKSSEIDAIDIEIDGEQKTVGFCPPNTRLQGCKDGEQAMLRSIKCSPN